MKLFAAILFFVIPFLAMANYATITKLRGGVFHVKNGVTQIAFTGQRVSEGDTLRTNPSSIVKIRFDRGSIMTIGPNSEVLVKSIKTGEPKIVSLLNGYLRAKFDDEKTDRQKLMIHTPSAALGVRGTEFNLIYNRDNRVTTALSLEGNVEFSSVEEENRMANDRVDLKEGEFSTTYARDELVSSPTKISPVQLRALQQNRDLKVRDKNSKVITQVKTPVGDLQDREQVIPDELMGEDHGHTRDNYISDRDGPRPGGYIDLSTGLYIDPPEGSKYNEEDGVFEVPVGLGGIDPETGEYIPPLGLILHPLRGFVIASTAIESGVYYVRKKTGAAAVKLIEGVSVVGTKVVKGLESVGRTFESQTGAIGKSTGKGLRFVGKKALTVGKKTGAFVHKKGLGSLNQVAEDLNSYLYYGPLRHIGMVLKKIPLVNALDLRFRDKLSHSSRQVESIYGQTEHIVNVSSAKNQLHFSSLYQKTFWKKIFLRPKFSFDKTNYFRTNVPEVKSLNNYRYLIGLDVGAMGKIKGVMVQSYFYSNFSYSSKMNNGVSYGRYLRDREFGFSKLIIGSDYISSRFDYAYGEYHQRNIYHGRYHHFSLSEIINLDNKNFFNLGINWSTRSRVEINKSVTMYGGKFEYFISHRQHRFKFSSWLDYKMIDDQLNRSFRGLEQELNFGIKLTKSFPKLFSTSFEYVMDSLFSDKRDVDGVGHRLGVSLNVAY